MPSDSLQLANFFSIMKLSRGRWKGPDTYPLTQGILRIFCQLLNQLFIFINAQTHSEKSWHSYLRHSDRQSPLFFILYSFSFYSYILFYQYLQRDQVTGLGSRMSNRFASCWGGGGRTGRHFFVIIPNRKTTAKSDQREMRTKNAVFVYRLIKSCTQNKNAFMKEK